MLDHALEEEPVEFGALGLCELLHRLVGKHALHVLAGLAVALVPVVRLVDGGGGGILAPGGEAGAHLLDLAALRFGDLLAELDDVGVVGAALDEAGHGHRLLVVGHHHAVEGDVGVVVGAGVLRLGHFGFRLRRGGRRAGGGRRAVGGVGGCGRRGGAVGRVICGVVGGAGGHREGDGGGAGQRQAAENSLLVHASTVPPSATPVWSTSSAGLHMRSTGSRTRFRMAVPCVGCLVRRRVPRRRDRRHCTADDVAPLTDR